MNGGPSTRVPRQWACPAWVVLMTLIVSAGCVSPIDRSRGLPPLFESYSAPENPSSERVGETAEKTEDRSWWAIRPLTLYERTGDKRVLSILWPLVYSRREGRDARDFLLPVWSYQRKVDKDGNEDWDAMIFPLFFWGNDHKEGPYFTALPIFGVLKGALGQRKTSWVLFPVYWQLENSQRVSHNVLWPIVNWFEGEHRAGWRVFPFYGRYTATTPQGGPKYDRRFYLWPFFHAQDNNLDTSRPVTSRWFFPFFGKIESSEMTRYSVLWPLFTYIRRENPYFRQNQVTYALPLLSTVYSRGPELQQTDIWPLFGRKRNHNIRGTSFRQFVLWPVQWYWYTEIGDKIDESYWILPLFWRNTHEDMSKGTKKSNTTFWPLVSHDRLEDGTTIFRFLDPLPFPHEHRVQRFYSRIFNLYRHVDRGEAGSDWDVLWGVLKGSRRLEGRSFSFLGGLFGREARPEGARWRFLYIPF